ncbi:MAG: methionine gamma-lyase family protein [Bacillota bacterium]|nr:methionine gamma-lyase family protein [Bacillota bacterium]
MDAAMKLNKYIEEATFDVKEQVKLFERTAIINQEKVLESFRQAKISNYHFQTSTGYGYGDVAREGIEEVFKIVFKAEKALVRGQLASGTHAIACCLYGLLRPGDKLISITGTPYDTLQSVLGNRSQVLGSLTDFGVQYQEVPLNFDLKPDLKGISCIISKEKPKLVLIQRSRGYHWRPSLSIKEIGSLIERVKEISPNTICFVDNCYGEFVEEKEPIEVGADIIAGSLIKNPGGGIATAGGYIVGKEELVELAAARLTAPGISGKVGATLVDPRLLFQGFFIAPHTVKQALVTAAYASSMFSLLGMEVSPMPTDDRTDIIQAIKLGSKEMLLAVCKAIQEISPIDSFLTPEPSPMAGYDDQVIMAGGTFIQGSSIELSADGPIREPYILFLQGALTSEHGKIAIDHVVKKLIETGII